MNAFSLAQCTFKRFLGYIKENPIDSAIMLSLFVFSFIVRSYRLGEVPQDFMCDEADNYQDVVINLYGVGMPLFGYDWKPQPAFSAHLLSWWTMVVGFGMAKARMLSALLTSVCVPVLYVVGKRLVRPYTAAAAGLLIATNPWFMNFSRSSWENGHICLYTVCAIYSFYRLYETEQFRWYFILGFWATIGALGYFSGRLILPIIVVSMIVYMLFEKRIVWKIRIIGILLVVLTFFVLFSFQLYDMITQWKLYNSRTATVALWNQTYPLEGFESMWSKMATQLSESFRAFWEPINNNTRYAPLHKPLLSPLLGPFLAIGMLVSLFQGRKWIVVWFSFIIPWVVTQGFATGAPDVARCTGLLIPAYLFIALGLDLLHEYHYGFSQKFIPAILIVFCAITCRIDWNTYFEWQAKEDTIKMRYPAIPGETFDDWVKKMINDIKVQGKTRSINVSEWYLYHKQYMEEIKSSEKAAVPEGQAAQVESNAEKRGDVVDSSDGVLDVIRFSNNNWEGIPAEINVGMPAIGDGFSGPSSVIWHGDILIPEDGTWDFSIVSDDGSILFMNESLVIDNSGHHAKKAELGRIYLKSGWNRILIAYNQDDGASHLSVQLRKAGELDYRDIANYKLRKSLIEFNQGIYDAIKSISEKKKAN